uniref:Uncharacterized protein n=1 Tax=Trieres chinensis TaxID=1514140 RepID=A0A7S2E8M7_TRICV
MIGTTTEVDGRIRSPRFTTWLCFMVFSLITMSSALEVVERYSETDMAMKNQRYAVASSISSFVINGIVVMMHLTPKTSSYIVATKLEGAVCLFLMGFNTATVAVASDPNNGLAVKSDGAVMNGNLYYFSWAGFVTSVVMSVSYLRSVYHLDVAGEMRNRSARLTLWAALLASSLIVMGSAANVYDAECNVYEPERTEKYCNRTAFAVTIGALGTMASLVVVGLKIATSRAPFVLEMTLSVSLFVLDAFGVAYVTSGYGPGAPLGNLYYFSWGAFISAFFLSSSCYESYVGARKHMMMEEEELSFRERGGIAESKEEGATADF